MNTHIEDEQEKIFRQAHEISSVDLRIEEQKRYAMSLIRKKMSLSDIKELSGLSESIILGLVKDFQRSHGL